MSFGKDLEVLHLGSVTYSLALKLQKEFHQQVAQGLRRSILLVLEHPSVITLGLHATPNNVLASYENLEKQGIGLEKIDRGGEATAHEPGQLIAYPILDMRTFKLSPRKYVEILELSVIDLLASYGLSAYRDNKFPGVWVNNTKVCAIGIRISRGVSYHGIALNVANSLATFSHIIPCGISDRGLSTMTQLLQTEVSIKEVADRFVQTLASKLEVSHLLAIKNEGDYMTTSFDLQ